MNFSSYIKLGALIIGSLVLTQCSEFFDFSSPVQPQAVDATTISVEHTQLLAQR